MIYLNAKCPVFRALTDAVKIGLCLYKMEEKKQKVRRKWIMNLKKMIT